MIDQELLAGIVSRIGHPGFGSAVMAAYAAGAGADMCSAFALREGPPQVLLAQSADAARSPFARIASLRYASRYWRRDTETLYNLGRAHRTVLTARRPAGSIRDIEYRVECYGEGEVGERLSICRSGATALIVNAYRDKDGGRFGPAEIEWAEASAQLIIAAVARHHELSAPRPAHGSDPAVLARHLRTLARESLSSREAQVLAYACLGAGREETADALGLAPTSVATYRRRGYAKLGVRNDRQLRNLAIWETPATSGA